MGKQEKDRDGISGMGNGKRRGGRMSGLVSVIIKTGREDRKYLVRCISSIRRQVYENKEWAIWAEDKTAAEYADQDVTVLHTDEIAEYLQKTEAEWVLFCRSCFVLAPDVLKELADYGEKGNSLPAAKYMVKGEDDFWEEENAFFLISPYGKLFRREDILKMSGTRERGCYALTALKYMEDCGAELAFADSFIYKPAVEAGDFDEGEIADISVELASKYRHFPDVNIGFAEGCLSQLWQEAIRRHNQGYFLILRQYIEAVAADEKLLPFILEAVRINQEQYRYMKDCTWEEFIFYQERADRRERDRIDCRELLGIEGLDLAQNAVDLYRDGRLGLKTLLASLMGWIKYKAGSGVR